MALTTAGRESLYTIFKNIGTKIRLKGYYDVPAGGGTASYTTSTLNVTWGSNTDLGGEQGLVLPLTGTYTFDVVYQGGNTYITQLEILNSSNNVIYFGDINEGSTATFSASGKYAVTNAFVVFG